MVDGLLFQVVDEVGRHITFRYEGVLPLADQELLTLLDILVNKADLIEVSCYSTVRTYALIYVCRWR